MKLGDHLGPDPGANVERLAAVEGFQLQLRNLRADFGQRSLAIFLGTEFGHDRAAFGTNRAIANTLVAQQIADVIDEALVLLHPRGIHVDLHQEMHPALQVQTQHHRPGAQHAQPRRRGRRQIQRDHIGITELVAQGVGQLQLCLRTAHPSQ